ncbi:MAG: hypothetical protein IKX42_09270 [Fibrobacter sp.]|nr:hypothetical protein [Fibrobacter sp.]
MKKSFHMISLLALLLTFAASTAWAAQRTLTADGNGGYYISMPATGVDTLVIPDGVTTFKIYDDRGLEPGYNINCNGSLMLTAPDGKRMLVEGYLRTSDYLNSGRGYLFIYDGANDDATELVDTYGYETIRRHFGTNENMYIIFRTTDRNSGYEGLELTITIDDPNAPHEIVVNPPYGGNGTIISDYTEAAPGTVVTLTANPDSGYKPYEVYVKDEYDNRIDVTGSWYTTGNTYSFMMPNTKAFVYSSFEDDWYMDYLTIPETGLLSVNIPNYIKNIEVRDGDNKYNDGTVVLTAPEGSVIAVWGGVYGIENSDSLYVYDGTDSNAPLLLKTSVASVDYIYGTGRSMTIRYKRTGPTEWYIRRGLQLLVKVVDPSAEHEIYISENTKGDVESSLSKARLNTVVSLTASPAADYYLNDIEVSGDAYSSVAVTGGTWYSGNEASFTMPAWDVDVYANYVRELSADGGLSVVTPIMEPLRIVVPDSVKSFKVLGRSPSTGILSQPLILTASEGQMLTLGGNFPACSESVEDIELPYYNFYICDGDISNPGNNATSGKTISILFGDNGESYMDVTVNVVDPSKDPRSVFVETTGCGRVESELDLEAVTVGTLVKLVAIPDEGCFVGGTRAMGSMWDSEFPVSVTGGAWHSNDTIQFTMPYADVSVNVMFGEDPYRFIIVPTVDTVRAEIPKGISQFIVYDDGGPDGPYSNNADGYLVVTVPEDKLLRLDEKYLNLESCCDHLTVYDGDNDITEAFLSGEYMDPIQSLTFHFTSDWGASYDGFELVMSAVEKEEHQIVLGEAEGGFLSVDPVTGMAFPGDTVTISATLDSGYVFNGITVFDGDEYYLFDVEDGAWYNGEVKFVMPMKDVYVKPVFVDLNYAFPIRIPKTDTLRVTVPEGIKWLNIFDDGGPGDNYSDGANGVLILTVPEGYSLVTGGEIDMYDENDSLYIYNGAGVNDKVLAKVTGGLEFYDENEIYSTGRSLTYCLKSNTEENYSGLWMYATVLKTSSFGAVAVYDMNEYKYARIDGDYDGNDAVNISTPIEVDWIEYAREFTSGVPSTIVLPFTLPEGSSVNADFYQLAEVVQVDHRWKATMAYIGDGNLPEANTPYAIIPKDDYLEFSWGDDYVATLQTNEIDTVKVSNDNWLFVGMYSSKTWAAGDEELGLAYAFAASDNEGGAKKGKFGRIKAGASANPLRAYLRKKDASVKLSAVSNRPPALGEDRYSVSFMPEEIDVEFVKASANGSAVETMAVGRMNTRTGEFKMLRNYDLKGRRLNSAPKARGAYYGKKVLKK